VKVVALIPDLMDRSKVLAAFPLVSLIARPQDLAQEASDADLVLVDLNRAGVLDAVSSAMATGWRARVVGFASHVDEEVLSSAGAAGVEALPRSVFFRRLPAMASHDS
jgi:hypothetical protein